jgi:hypothetical protein
MGVPPGNRPAYRGIGSEAYLNGTSQDELVLPVPSLSRGAESKEHPRTPSFRLVEPTARREGRSYYSRSLRSAQSRKRVPSFAVAVTPRRDEISGLVQAFVHFALRNP